MRTTTAILVLMFAVSALQAQNDSFNYFNFDMGVVAPSHNFGNNSYGFGGYIEPKIYILENLAVGLKFDGIVAGGGNFKDVGDEFSLSMSAITSTAVMTDYFFSTDRVMPFAGLGFGRYIYGGQTIASTDSDANITQSAGESWGLCPRVGTQIGPFRIAVECNWVFKPSTYVYQSVGSDGITQEVNASGEFSRSYIGLKIGGVIGENRWLN